MVKMNNKGWLRIVEAVIAILIIISSVLIVMQSKKTQREQSFCSILPGLLDEIAKNESMRKLILADNTEVIEKYAENSIRDPSLVFKARICDIDVPCILEKSGGLEKVDICAEQRIISTSQDQSDFSPKKLKVFLFRI